MGEREDAGSSAGVIGGLENIIYLRPADIFDTQLIEEVTMKGWGEYIECASVQSTPLLGGLRDDLAFAAAMMARLMSTGMSVRTDTFMGKIWLGDGYRRTSEEVREASYRCLAIVMTGKTPKEKIVFYLAERAVLRVFTFEELPEILGRLQQISPDFAQRTEAARATDPRHFRKTLVL